MGLHQQCTYKLRIGIYNIQLDQSQLQSITPKIASLRNEYVPVQYYFSQYMHVYRWQAWATINQQPCTPVVKNMHSKNITSFWNLCFLNRYMSTVKICKHIKMLNMFLKNNVNWSMHQSNQPTQSKPLLFHGNNGKIFLLIHASIFLLLFRRHIWWR